MLFTPVPRTVGALIAEVDSGKLGLPELQRGYVWKATKVRDLLDSMMKGYPIGFLMIWDSSSEGSKSKIIGTESKAYTAPKNLIIDGQQRLTSLYAVMQYKEIVDERFVRKRITISFNPFTRAFEVGNTAIRRAAEWIYNISDVFLNESRSFAYITELVDRIEKSRKEAGSFLNDQEKQTIQQNVMDLLSLKNYSLPTLEINSQSNEESVADIFVRANSGGEKLGEDDFILTLISVHWLEGRKKIEEFCKKQKQRNALFEPTPTHIVRAAMGYGFKRARLHYAYLLLRGRDFESEVFSEELRDRQFLKLEQVLDKVLNEQEWAEFKKCILSSGYVTKSLVPSQNALIYTYVLYLIGKFDFGVSHNVLRGLIARWFFMCSVTRYYTDSPESTMETDLADMRNITDGSGFISLLEERIESHFTNDYFEITLPYDLATSSPRNPAWLAYCASLNILEAKVLFSNLTIRKLFDSEFSARKRALERHHLFPKAYLKRIGIGDNRDRNQTANFAFLEWIDNDKIRDKSPAEYLGERLKRIPPEKRTEVYEHHALPEGWEHLEYHDFLNKRRKLMANIIRKGYDQLKVLF